MKKVINLIFYVGFLFFGGGFIIALSQFVLYNGLNDYFEYVKADNVEIDIQTTFSNKIEITNIHYLYTVDDQLYESKESIATTFIEKKNIAIDEIYYCKNFPSLSYVGDNKLTLKKSKYNMIIMILPLIFIFLIYRFADMSKWIGVYTKGVYRSTKENRLE